MRIQVDTKENTIRVDENINLGELIKDLNKLFPKGEWKKYTIETNSQWYWYPYPTYQPCIDWTKLNPIDPYNPYQTTCDDTHVFNFQMI